MAAEALHEGSEKTYEWDVARRNVILMLVETAPGAVSMTYAVSRTWSVDDDAPRYTDLESAIEAAEKTLEDEVVQYAARRVAETERAAEVLAKVLAENEAAGL